MGGSIEVGSSSAVTVKNEVVMIVVTIADPGNCMVAIVVSVKTTVEQAVSGSVRVVVMSMELFR